jgi:hypothetical protein
MPNSAEIKAERRKPSGEKPCDIEDSPSLTGVLAHFRLHQFNAIRLYARHGQDSSATSIRLKTPSVRITHAFITIPC